MSALSLEKGTARVIRQRTGVDLPPGPGVPVRRPLVHVAALTVLPEAGVLDLPAIARAELAAGSGGEIRTAIAAFGSQPPAGGPGGPGGLARWGAVEDAVAPLRDQLLERLGHPPGGDGPVRLCTRIHLARVVDGTTHPVVGAHCLGWYTCWTRPGSEVATLVAAAAGLADRWYAEPRHRDALTAELAAFAATHVDEDSSDLLDRAV